MKKNQIDCEQALRQLYVYLDRELSDDDHAQMEHHLHTCKSCFSRMEFERRLQEKVGALDNEEAADTTRDRILGILKGF